MDKFFLIAIGGALGSAARWGVQMLLNPLSQKWHFPMGTLAVNCVGCFCIGLTAGLLATRWASLPDAYRLAITVGVLGGFTTFSSYGLDTVGLAEQGFPWRAAGNVLASNALGFLLVFMGDKLVRGV